MSRCPASLPRTAPTSLMICAYSPGARRLPVISHAASATSPSLSAYSTCAVVIPAPHAASCTGISSSSAVPVDQISAAQIEELPDPPVSHQPDSARLPAVASPDHRRRFGEHLEDPAGCFPVFLVVVASAGQVEVIPALCGCLAGNMAGLPLRGGCRGFWPCRARAGRVPRGASPREHPRASSSWSAARHGVAGTAPAWSVGSPARSRLKRGGPPCPGGERTGACPPRRSWGATRPGRRSRLARPPGARRLQPPAVPAAPVAAGIVVHAVLARLLRRGVLHPAPEARRGGLREGARDNRQLGPPPRGRAPPGGSLQGRRRPAARRGVKDPLQRVEYLTPRRPVTVMDRHPRGPECSGRTGCGRRTRRPGRCRAGGTQRRTPPPGLCGGELVLARRSG